jgi:dynein heavy chain
MIYTNVSRGLFEAHKIIFSFLIITSINRNSKKVKETHWNLLLRGAGPITPEEMKKRPENPDTKILGPLSWDLIFYMDLNDPEVYGGITESIVKQWPAWLEWGTCAEPHTTPLPLEWAEKLDNFAKLIVLKAFRPEKLLFAFQNYVIEEIGQFFVESPSATMDVIYQDTDVKTPLIFVLSAGADPTGSLIKFAKERNYAERLQVISLGQGQGPKAEKLIHASKKNGDWVLLQNCHLAKSWMTSLETIVINFSSEENDINPDFRLYLTSMPAEYFPVSVLQNGVKLTTEPPRGMRANLKRTYQNFTDTFLTDCKKPEAWKKLVFGLSFFHAIL